jgi:hypothetical protein
MWEQDTRSVKFLDNTSTVGAGRASVITIAPVDGPSTEASGAHTWGFLASRRDFEVVLQGSRVYTRVKSNESDIMTSTSSVVRTHAWSILSGINLKDVSIIAVFRLPITLDNINNIRPGLTFTKLLSEQVPSASTTQSMGNMHQRAMVPTMAQAGEDFARRFIGPTTYATSIILRLRDATVRSNTYQVSVKSLFRRHQTNHSCSLMVIDERFEANAKLLLAYTTSYCPAVYVPSRFGVCSLALR